MVSIEEIFSNPFIDALKPDNPITIFLLIMMVVGVAVGVIVSFRLKEPKAKRIDKFVLTMPKTGHQFAVTAYEYPEAMELPNLEGLKELDAAKGVAEFLIANRDRMHFYLLKYDGDGSIRSGKAIMMTHNRIDDPDYSEPMDSVFDFVQLQRVHRRLLAQSAKQGRIFLKSTDFGGEMIDLIYYPMMHPDPKERVVVLENAEATLQAGASIKEWVAAQKVSKYNQIRANAAEAHARHMEQVAGSLTGDMNNLMAEHVQKRYDGFLQQIAKAILGPYVAGFIVMIATAALFGFFQQQMPGYTDIHYILLGGIVGEGVIWAINYFRK